MIKTLSRHLRRLVHGTTPPVHGDVPRTGALDYYVQGTPTPANIAALFQGQWISKLPSEIGFAGGGINLFDDARIKRLIELVDIVGKDILELGPLEAGHTTMLANAGAKSVTAIESNSLAFLRCLAVKEALGLTSAKFLLGDFVEYLRSRQHEFDVCVACGVLYHMQSPVELLELLSHACRRHLYLWTHYYDARLHQTNPDMAAHLKESQTCSWKGFRHSLVRYDYAQTLDSTAFCGGTAPFSYWLPRADLLAALDFFGFRDVRILADEVDHPHGSCISLIASR